MRVDFLRIDLDAQFRRGGPQVNVDWVERLLGLEGDTPEPWWPDGRFDVQVDDAPDAERLLGGARLEGF